MPSTSKALVHKKYVDIGTSFFDHVCKEDVGLLLMPDNEGVYACCTTLWSKVTCKECLAEKPKPKRKKRKS